MCFSPYNLKENQVYVGSDILPRNNGFYTVAPGNTLKSMTASAGYKLISILLMQLVTMKLVTFASSLMQPSADLRNS